MATPPGTAIRIKYRDDIFFDELSKHGLVTPACRVAEVDPSSMYQKRMKDQEFRQRWEAALETAADRLEQEAIRRSVEGIDEVVIHQGQVINLYVLDKDGRPVIGKDGLPVIDLDKNGRPKVLTTKKYSDSLLTTMLKANRAKFRDKVEITGANGGPLQVEETEIQIARKLAFALSLGAMKAQQAKQNASPQADDGKDLL